MPARPEPTWVELLFGPLGEPERPKKKACRSERLERMLRLAVESEMEAGTADGRQARIELRWLVNDCRRCGKCKTMPPRM